MLCHSQHADVSSLGFSPQGLRVAAAALDITSDSPVERQEKGGLAQWRNISPCLSPFCHVKKKKKHVRSKFSLVIPASELAVIAPGHRNIHSD